jgi:hypothetical protein
VKVLNCEKIFEIDREFHMKRPARACSMPIVTNAHCDGKLPIAMLPIVTV